MKSSGEDHVDGRTMGHGMPGGEPSFLGKINKQVQLMGKKRHVSVWDSFQRIVPLVALVKESASTSIWLVG